MYTFLKNSPARSLVTMELPSFAVSMVIAEAFYEFGSFILECGAFLATWWMISFVFDKINRWRKAGNKSGINLFAIKSRK
jgi:hypothetical protein